MWFERGRMDHTPKKAPIAKIIGIVVVAIACLALLALAGGAIYLYRLPDEPLRTYNPDIGPDVDVVLDPSLNDSYWALNTYIPLLAKVNSVNPIKSISLVINNQLYETIELLPEISTTTRAPMWNWQPGAIGDFVLIVQAEDSKGTKESSQPVIIHAFVEVGPKVSIKTEEDTTLALIAGKRQIPVQTLLDSNPGLSAEEPLPAGKEIMIPLDPAPVTNPHPIPPFDPPAKSEILPLKESDFAKYLEKLGLPPQTPDGDKQPAEELPDEKDGTLGEPPQPPSPPGDSGSNGITSVLDNILKIPEKLKKLNDKTDESLVVPLKPKMSVKHFSGCELVIRLESSYLHWDNNWYKAESLEDGFHIFRSIDGGPYELITTLPKLVDELTEKSNPVFTDGYKDKNVYGSVSYMLGAFNGAGEAKSDPIVVSLAAQGCEPPESSTNPVKLKDGKISLPAGIDMAYFYFQYSVGDGPLSKGWRVPAGERTFVPNTGKLFDLNVYLDEIASIVGEADYKINMEVWGWLGGKLVHVGNFKTQIIRPVLLVCSKEGDGACSKGDGVWSTKINMSETKPVNEQVYEFKWIGGKNAPLDKVCLQLSTTFYATQTMKGLGNDGLLYTVCNSTYEGVIGDVYEYVMTVPLGRILYPASTADRSNYGWNYDEDQYLSDGLTGWPPAEIKMGDPFSVFARAYFNYGYDNHVYNRFSNTDVIGYKTSKFPSELPPLSSEFKSLFDVEILKNTYVPVGFESGKDEDFGCVIVDGYSEALLAEFAKNAELAKTEKDGAMKMLYEQLSQPKYSLGQKICPSPVPPECTDAEWLCGLKELWKTIKAAYNTWTEAWDMYAQWLTQVIAEAIPGCDERDWCKGTIGTAVNVAFDYMSGGTTNLPDIDRLAADNAAEFLYNAAVEYEKQMTGLDYSLIDTVCSDDMAGCQEKLADYFYDNLRQISTVKTQPGCNPAMEYEYSKRDLMPFCLPPGYYSHPAHGAAGYYGGVDVKVTRKNTPESLAADQSTLPYITLQLVVEGTKEGENNPPKLRLYPYEQQSLKWLEPGESQIYHFTLKPWEKRFAVYYWGGTSIMTATEMCVSYDSSENIVPCTNGGQDTWTFANPINREDWLNNWPDPFPVDGAKP